MSAAKAAAAAHPLFCELIPGTELFIQADDWFFGPDGREHRGAYGPVHIVDAEKVLGFKPKNSAQWFACIGDPDGGDCVFIAGCRIHYVGTYKPANTHILDLS